MIEHMGFALYVLDILYMAFPICMWAWYHRIDVFLYYLFSVVLFNVCYCLRVIHTFLLGCRMGFIFSFTQQLHHRPIHSHHLTPDILPCDIYMILMLFACVWVCHEKCCIDNTWNCICDVDKAPTWIQTVNHNPRHDSYI